jgi:hypothetical protein
MSQNFSRKRIWGFSNQRLQENVFNRGNYLGGNLNATLLLPPTSSGKVCLGIILLVFCVLFFVDAITVVTKKRLRSIINDNFL